VNEPLVSVVIPFHAARERNGMLERASASVRAQAVPVKLIQARDVYSMGAAITRNHGLMEVDTPWVAFLDSDDTMDPDHVEKILRCAEETGADYVYPWFRMVGGSDPFPMFFGRPWDNDAPHSTTITILVRTEIAKQLGFKNVAWEDWDFTLRCVAGGFKIVHLPERTWTWYHHGANTSGTPGRGDAR
jgi:glycosyltransferase involved in cell wall biosynthesis